MFVNWRPMHRERLISTVGLIFIVAGIVSKIATLSYVGGAILVIALVYWYYERHK